MAIITGKTFDHRETLKSYGAKWNPITKSWSIGDDSIFLDDIRRIIGVTVTGGAKPEAKADEPADTEIKIEVTDTDENNFDDEAAAEDFRKTYNQRPKHNYATIFEGDAMTQFDRMNADGATQYAEFSSLSALCDFVEKCSYATATNNQAWRVSDGRSNFTKSKDMPEALHLARGNWSEGVALAERIIDVLHTDHAVARVRRHSVAGGSVNVGRMLTGNPLHMVKRPKSPASKTVTLFVNATASSIVSSDDMIARATAVAAMSDLLEANGYACEIVSFFCSAKTVSSYVVTTLKQAGEPLSISDIIFGLGHPAYLRRFGFAVYSKNEALRPIMPNYGTPFKPAIEETRTTFVLDAIPAFTMFSGDFISRVRQLFAATVPANFPINLK